MTAYYAIPLIIFILVLDLLPSLESLRADRAWRREMRGERR